MNENEQKALNYYYLKMKKSISDGSLRGLKLKSCMSFVDLISSLSHDLNNIVDLEEVLSYGK